MILLTSLVSALSFFCMHHLWRYVEQEFGFLTSLFLISTTLITFYGVYAYFKKSPYIEIDLGTFSNKNKNVSELNNGSVIGIFERYNKERANYLTDDLINFKQGEGAYIENKLNKFIDTQSERYFNEMENTDEFVHNSKLSFFGLSMTSPKSNQKLYQDYKYLSSSNIHELCSPSILADTFIYAATVARSCQSQDLHGNLNFNQLQYSNTSTNKAMETKNNMNSRLLSSVGLSFQSNIKSARSRLENYVSSLQYKITRRNVRNSLPGCFLSSKPAPDSANKSCTKLNTYGISSVPNQLIELLDHKSTKSKGNSSIPTRKTYKSFLSPLPTSKPSPILLLTGKKE